MPLPVMAIVKHIHGPKRRQIVLLSE
jgi:hypothetical protein